MREGKFRNHHGLGFKGLRALSVSCFGAFGNNLIQCKVDGWIPSLTVPIPQRTLVLLKKQPSINMSIQEGCLLGCIPLLNALEGTVYRCLVVKNNKNKITSKSALREEAQSPGRECIRMLASSQPVTRTGQTGTGYRL